MSEKTRRKKDGQDRNKDMAAMHEAVHERKEHARPRGRNDEGDRIVEFKSGSANDRTRQGAT